jgi:phenylalanyl-tRNA synthetase beta chain
MNISYNWLKDLIDTDLSAEQIADALTRAGLAVEGIHPHKDDLVLDIDLTSNRPDCLSHRGIARELGVIVNGRVKNPVAIARGSDIDASVVTIEAPDLCHRFTARIIRDVKVGPSPQWLVDRLEALGERPINNVADITNFVMLELGQPMHAFDLDKLSESRIVVRRAEAGEKIIALDEEEYELDDNVLAICDAEKPVAIGGVIGGLDSSISNETTNVLLEVAYFDRANIRQTSRKLNVATNASYRFERGVDVENLERASDRAAQLIVELAGGSMSDIVDLYPQQQPAKTVISVNISAAVKRLTGLDVSTQECERILDSLGIRVLDRDSSATTFASPTWRHDIAIEEDLVEEIARHAGYENIGEELPPAYGAGEYQTSETRKRSLRRHLSAHGFNEAITYSFIDTKHDDTFAVVPSLAVDNAPVTLRDSVIDGAVRMRRTLIAGLIDAIRENFNQQRKDLCLFEIGKAFMSAPESDETPTERELFALVMTGSKVYEGRGAAGLALDLYDLKGAVEAAFEAAELPHPVFEPADIPHLRKGQSTMLSIDGIGVGYLGRLADDVAAAYKFKQPIYLAEVDLAALLGTPATAAAYRPLSRFPMISRDVSFVVERSFMFSTLKEEVESASVELLKGFSFVDIYEGKGLSESERSLTVRFEYRAADRTLTEGEVDDAHGSLIEILGRKLGIKPRF